MTLDTPMWNGSVGELSSCVIIFGIFRGKIPCDFLSSLCILLCFCFLCIVICMHSFQSAHIWMAYTNVICTKSFNILALFYNGHIVLNYTAILCIVQ